MRPFAPVSCLSALAIAALSCTSSNGAATADAGSTDAPASPGRDADPTARDASVGDTADDAGHGIDVIDAATPLDAAVPSFAAGVTTRTWVDAARGTPANGTAPAQPNRTLVTEIWYPATGPATSASVTRDAPLAPGGPYPLVLFVHGSSSGRLVYSYLTAGLARAGYVVAAADFPLTALGTPGGASDLGVAAQVGDLSFLCDRLAAASADAGDALRGAVDASGYAVVGHSTGGAVAALAAFAGDDDAITHDPRVRAIVPLSGDACMFDASFFARRSVPVLAVGATDDLFVRIANSGQWVFDNTSPPHILATLVGGSHVYFTDMPLPDVLLNPVPTGPSSPLATTLRAYGDAAACTPIPPAGTDPAMAFDAQHALVLRLVTAYLEAEMRGNRAPLDGIVSAHDPALRIQQ